MSASSENAGKDPVRVAAGLKSTLARDNVSDEAKEHAQERLDALGATTTDEVSGSRAHKGGASRAKTEVVADDYEDADDEEYEDGEDKDMHSVRVDAGYKATLKNPRVSKEAKQNAREHLEEADAI